MSAPLSHLIVATTHWLVRAYPPVGGVMDAALSEIQVRQAVTAAAWLRYPTSVDAGLVALAGPGGCARLDRIAAADAGRTDGGRTPDWCTWVDEVVASWAACLLGDAPLARAAVAALEVTEHMDGPAVEFRRLLAPGERDRRAAALARHPDLLAPVAGLHRAELLARLAPVPLMAEE
ncbi:hypothetical protein [Streptomyces sp. GC420]|uniref:hypothetical protein n=1 Tax=Streptomyces sp. GC420 TaxID=2697568 RepID=UPI001414FEA0|nr:hypothetical protein [Streptomyces sp. GC420]NBM19254.1 hypothetical protein [Streptomyces sp. GC420]